MTQDPKTIQTALENFIGIMSTDFGVSTPMVIFVPVPARLQGELGCYYAPEKVIVIYKHRKKTSYLRTCVHEFVHHLQYDRQHKDKAKGVKRVEYEKEYEALKIGGILSHIYKEKFIEVMSTLRAEPLGRHELCKRLKDVLSELIEKADVEMVQYDLLFDPPWTRERAIKRAKHKGRALSLLEDIIPILHYVDKACTGSWLGSSIELGHMYLDVIREVDRDYVDAYSDFIVASKRTVEAYDLKVKFYFSKLRLEE